MYAFAYRNKDGKNKTIIAQSKNQAKQARHALVLNPEAEVVSVTRILKTTNPQLIITPAKKKEVKKDGY